MILTETEWILTLISQWILVYTVHVPIEHRLFSWLSNKKIIVEQYCTVVFWLHVHFLSYITS